MVSLNGQTYMELAFDYDSQTTSVVRTYDFTTSGGGSEDSGDSSSSQGDDTSGDGGEDSLEGDGVTGGGEVQ